jgi:hypothetical protein
MEITEIKKHNIDTYDIYINVKDRLEFEDIKNLNKIIKEEIDRYIEFLGIDKNCIIIDDYKKMVKNIKINFDKN